jgi:hypothetical protein
MLRGGEASCSAAKSAYGVVLAAIRLGRSNASMPRCSDWSRRGGSLSRVARLGHNLRKAISKRNSLRGLPMITSLENVTDADDFQAYLDWITIEFDEDRMDGAEAQRRLLEARRFLFELRPDIRDQYGTMTNH